jgi:hypothetical protein
MEQSIRLERRFAIIDEWLLDLDISDRAVRLYAVLARYADNDTHKAYPSRDTLAERLRCSTKSVDRAAQELLDAGAMTKQHRHNSSIIYTLRVVEGGRHHSPGGSSPVSRGVDTGVHLTRTTKLKPTKLELLNSGFAQFWAIYPKKDDKPLAKRSFEKALTRTTLDTIIAGAERYRDDPNREQAFTKNPSTWLNADAWENDPLPSRVVSKPRKLTNAEEGFLLTQRLRAERLAREQAPKELDYDMGLRLKGVDDVD